MSTLVWIYPAEFLAGEYPSGVEPVPRDRLSAELMAVFPLDVDVAGMKLKFANVGLVHESNGQMNPLSRSWNRTDLQLGLERGDFTLLTRVWKRVNESRDDDDNADIIDYMGRGDIVGTWRSGGHQLSLLTRYNFSTDKGALQLGRAFPLAQRLKGYVQYFSGYGHSLIDYNGKEQVLGLGLQVTF